MTTSITTHFQCVLNQVVLVLCPELDPLPVGALDTVPDIPVLVGDPEAELVELAEEHKPENHFWILSNPLGSLGHAALQTLRVEV